VIFDEVQKNALFFLYVALDKLESFPLATDAALLSKAWWAMLARAKFPARMK